VIRSMTGFASVSREEAGQQVSVTVKSVNHRFLDVQVKMPSALAAVESRLKALVQQRLTRGRVEIALSWDQRDETPREVVLNERLLAQINTAVERARGQGLVTGALSASDVCRIPHVLDVRAATERDCVSDETSGLVERAVGDALDALVIMRETEGLFLAADLDARLLTLLTFVETVERQAAQGQAALDARLRERLEEISRMRGHVEHWRQLADGPEPCGRKLDFLVQEMNREINTIGSKAEGLKATESVVGAKAELERVREQVQNAE